MPYFYKYKRKKGIDIWLVIVLGFTRENLILQHNIEMAVPGAIAHRLKCKRGQLRLLKKHKDHFLVAGRDFFLGFLWTLVESTKIMRNIGNWEKKKEKWQKCWLPGELLSCNLYNVDRLCQEEILNYMVLIVSSKS